MSADEPGLGDGLVSPEIRSAWLADGVGPGWHGASTASLRFVKGDATSPQAAGPKVIAHVCNWLGG